MNTSLKKVMKINTWLLFLRLKTKILLQRYEKFWNEIKNQIETIYDVKPIIYEKYFMKIKFNLYTFILYIKVKYHILLHIIIKIPSCIIVTRLKRQ